MLAACQLATATAAIDASVLQTAVVSADATERKDWHYGKKGLTYDPEGPTNL